jgi:outer membrane protein assembly factor BamB
MNRKLSFAPLLGSLSMLVACTGVGVGSGATSSGCAPGGANENQHVVGDQPGGVKLGLGEIAVAPDGSYVIFEGEGRLSVGWPASGLVEDLPITQPTKLAFSKKRDVVYVGSNEDSKLHAVDVRTKKELWASPLDTSDTFNFRIESSDDDTRLVASGLSHFTLLDAATGASVAEQDFEQPIVDVALPSTGARALVVTQETWSSDATPLPTAKVAVVALSDGKTSAFDVPNCASRLAVTPDGTRAFLSPTSCNKDPVSLLDLTPGAELWVKNLPGFGPLAMAQDGASAIAFLDTHNLDETLFDDPKLIPPHGAGDPQYYIMTLDTKSLAYQFTVVGDTLPRYALTPDGNVLLVDSANSVETPLRLFDTKAHTFRAVVGVNVRLDNFVISSDALHVYALGLGLVDIDVQASFAEAIQLPFKPLNINIAPDDQTLYLRSSPSEVCVFSLKARECATTFSGAVVTTP